ncbi:hypothetical protein [Erythrobacter sp. EC-HK427]|uniref:hypothetical protein n=1 Tax=Erythrobacter sp. EC-HK427 TaxID=2038396 RepID=UPI001259B61C|nr:hypothetical protein [Erythrobacter sp. EC-HK427]VVT07223.1 conserved hypothetical protein [Erythrobacter sp. EC-HK427]
MTKRREPLTYHAALTTIAARIGWDRCGALCGVTDRAVRNWSDPDCETEIRLIDAERLDRAYIASGGDHAPFHRLFALRVELATRDDVECLVNLIGHTAKESGEAVAALLETIQNSDCRETRRRAQKELQEAVDSMTDCLAALGEQEK